jgi:hypothetical protein
MGENDVKAAVKEALVEAKNGETKAGIKTSEGWITLLIVLAGALGPVLAKVENPWVQAIGLAAAAIAGSSYAQSRAKVKVSGK